VFIGRHEKRHDPLTFVSSDVDGWVVDGFLITFAGVGSSRNYGLVMLRAQDFLVVLSCENFA
jgi:hypothetical protein